MRLVQFAAIAIAAFSAMMWLGEKSANAASQTYYFDKLLKDNGAGNVLLGQMSVTVDDGVGAGKVRFTFSNNVGVASNIAEIYFQDGTLFGISSVVNSSTGTATPTFAARSSRNCR